MIEFASHAVIPPLFIVPQSDTLCINNFAKIDVTSKLCYNAIVN